MRRAEWITLFLFVWGLSIAAAIGHQVGFNQGTDACEVISDSELIGIPA